MTSDLSFAAIFEVPVGKLGIKIANDKLVKIEFLTSQTAILAPTTLLAKEVVAQIQQYFKNPNFSFSIPLVLSGTQLQQNIWYALATIPVGTTITYGDFAKQITTGARVVGNACRRNPLPIIFPCHRVVAKNGLGGFCGQCEGESLTIKQQLLAFEAQYCCK
jgi:methylated-DNA-[protein]-cysteine S-methyltransferase